MVTSKKKKNQTQTSNHQNWELIFKALQQLLHKQAQKLDSLLQERKLFQQRIHLQRLHWNSDNRLFKDVISQLRRQLLSSELEKSFEIAKGEFRVNTRHRNSVVNKLKLEHVQCDLDDLKAWFDILSHRCTDKAVSSPSVWSGILKAKGGSNTSMDGSDHQSKLEKEVALLKHEYEKLSTKHKSDMSALQDKYNFVWNQFEEMERNYTNQLQTKNDNISRANEKIRILMLNMEQMQSASKKKDEAITHLKDEADKKDEEISRLSNELEFIKSKITGGSNEPSTSGSKGKKIRGKKQSPALEEDATNAQLQATISDLRAKVTELQTEADRKSKEISTLSKELKLKGSEETPLKLCTTRPPSSRLRGSRNAKEEDGIALRKETSSAGLVSEQGGRRAKRKQDCTISLEDTPRLFTSQFKIPKLRSQSPRGR